MKFLVALLLYVLIFPNQLFAQLWVVDPLEAVYPDRNSTGNWSSEWEADFIPASEIACLVVVQVPEHTPFTLSADINGTPLTREVWSELIDVPVEQNTGVDSRTERFKGIANPDVIRRAPFRIFEVIQPVVRKTFIGTGKYQAYRFTLPDKWKSSKKVHVNFTLTAGNKEVPGLFTPTIHSVEIPSPSKSDFFYTNWFNLSKMEYHHGLERWSDQWFSMLNKYAALMVHGRQNAIIIPGELIYLDNDEIHLDEKKMWRFIKVFKDHGFKYFEAPHLLNRGPGDDWGDPELKVALTGKGYYSGGEEDVEKIMSLIRSFTVKYDLLDNWLQHISDEPTPVNAKCYRDAATKIKDIFPQVKIMEATNAREHLTGAIDIWCPIINDFQENEEFFRSREEQDEQILVYTCLVPGGKWLNRTLDMEKLRQVYFGWGAAHYNTDGYLHWGLNQYKADPYMASAVKHPSPAAGPDNYLPAGDTHIIYPGTDGPLSSLRFEAHRIGIEDYEVLDLLKNKDGDAYEKVMDDLFRSYTDYNTDFRDYRKVKKQMLTLLSK